MWSSLEASWRVLRLPLERYLCIIDVCPVLVDCWAGDCWKDDVFEERAGLELPLFII